MAKCETLKAIETPETEVLKVLKVSPSTESANFYEEAAAFEERAAILEYDAACRARRLSDWLGFRSAPRFIEMLAAQDHDEDARTFRQVTPYHPCKGNPCLSFASRCPPSQDGRAFLTMRK